MIGFNLKNVCISIPDYSNESFSLRHKLLGRAEKLNKKQILNNINLSIREGDRVGLVGHNGAGKSSFLKLLSGSYFPTSGHISHTGTISSLLDIKFGLDPEGNGIDNIKLKLLSMRIIPNKKIINDIVEFSDLKDQVFYPIKHFSSGMLLRLGFAISTYITPDILLLDEWLSVGDVEFKEKSKNRMDDLYKKSSVLVLASHDHSLLNDKCNRLIKFDNGQIVSDEYIN